MSNFGLEKEVTGLIGKPDRSPVDQNKGECVCLGLCVYGYLYTCVSQSSMYVCGTVTVCVEMGLCVHASVYLYTQGRQKRKRGFPTR